MNKIMYTPNFELVEENGVYSVNNLTDYRIEIRIEDNEARLYMHGVNSSEFGNDYLTVLKDAYDFTKQIQEKYLDRN